MRRSFQSSRHSSVAHGDGVQAFMERLVASAELQFVSNSKQLQHSAALDCEPPLKLRQQLTTLFCSGEPREADAVEPWEDAPPPARFANPARACMSPRMPARCCRLQVCSYAHHRCPDTCSVTLC